MAFLHRKFLPKPENISDHVSCTQPPLPLFRQRLPLPQPPPPPRPSLDKSFPPLLTIMFGGLVITLCFICYLTCVTRYRRRRTNYANTDHETRQDFVNEDLGPITLQYPIWLINTIGLDESQIESIQVFKYKRDEKLIEGTDCSVCLSEFEDDESLRLLPKCSHAFHVPCIDTWLRSHKNCPLCRAPIVENTNDQTKQGIIQSSSIESSTSGTTETQGNDFETIDDHDHDHHVVEVENSEEIVKTNLGDHSQVQDEKFVAMRRSFSNSQLISWKKQTLLEKRVSPTESSMPKGEHKLKETSSSNIHLCGKITKSASFARSFRKARSFTSTCSPYNQAYLV